jgi:hypothetical protein
MASLRLYGSPVSVRVVFTLAMLLEMRFILSRWALNPVELMARLSRKFILLGSSCDDVFQPPELRCDKLRGRFVKQAVFRQRCHFTVDVDTVSIPAKQQGIIG